ncbi:MAG: MFS transporter [Dehalococcoidia bacterium]
MAEAAATMTPPDAPAASRNPFRVVQYRWYWASSFLSAMGVGIQIVTVPLYIRDRVPEDDRALLIALALVCQSLPAALLILFGGVAADRFQRRTILMRVALAAAVVSSVYIGLAGTGFDGIWPVFFLGAIVGSCDAFGQPARGSMVPHIVPRAALQNGVILSTVAFMSAFQFLGPAVGGLLADFASLTVAFIAEVAFLLIGALAATRLRPMPLLGTGRSVLADLRDGLGYVRRTPTIRWLILFQLLPGMFLMGPFRVTAVDLVTDVLDASDKFVGLLSSGFGIGVIAGSIMLTIFPIRRRGLLLCASPIWGGLIFILYGLSEHLAISLALMVPWGLSAASFINMAFPLIQENADPARLGRVSSVSNLAFQLALPLGYAQAGLIATVWGPQSAAITSGVAIALLGVLSVAFLQPIRKLR